MPKNWSNSTRGKFDTYKLSKPLLKQMAGKHLLSITSQERVGWPVSTRGIPK
jgi:hypothetical protein